MRIVGLQISRFDFEYNNSYYKSVKVHIYWEHFIDDWIGKTTYVIVECDGIPILFLDYNSDIKDELEYQLPSFHDVFSARRAVEASTPISVFDKYSDSTGTNWKTLISDIIKNFYVAHKHWC